MTTDCYLAMPLPQKLLVLVLPQKLLVLGLLQRLVSPWE